VIRRASLSDLATVVHWRLRLVAELRDVSIDSLGTSFRDATHAWLDAALASGTYFVWLAETSSEFVGVAAVAPLRRPPRPEHPLGYEGYVVDMLVPEAHRRGGIGSALLSRVETDCRALGMTRLWLHTTPAGRPLYERHGFGVNEGALEKVL